ncbi:extensin family protein [Streptomyces sp. DSM 42041]|uniref:Extensin family protein n=1 Tax=Streptomyces hazeniae TaxID=3075538 RepID=A0ABU2NN74_9ACTN|nr:extensin family protein [Streptomyces sp. DSM 42041]MDT0378220.1 extensin family protein [Streptomyces sp. DSM 42041]
MQEPQDRPVGHPGTDARPDKDVTSRIDRRLFLGGVGAATTAAMLANTSGTAYAAEEPAFAPLPAEMQPPASASLMALKTFSRIDGTPVYYWRGNRGNTTLRDWRCTPAFYDRLVVWIRDLRRLSEDGGFGNVKFLVSAGFYVNRSGQHGNGTAMDLDLVRWGGGRQSSPLDGHHAGDRTRRRRYLAVDATCRRRFRYVLDGWYNAAHRDHIHADFGGLPTKCSKGSSSDTKFVQAMSNNFMGAGIAVDGVWGPQTEKWFNRARNRLSIEGNPHASIDSWRTMLARVARHGFRNEAF